MWGWIFLSFLIIIVAWLFWFAFASERGRTFFWQGLAYYNLPDNTRYEIINYDINADEKIALVYTKPGEKLGEKYTTGYYFNNYDFYPPLSKVDWKNFTGTIIGFVGHDGQTCSIPEWYNSIYQELKQAKLESKLDRELRTQEYELRKQDHLEENRKTEVFTKSEVLGAIRKLAFGEVEKKEEEKGGINE